MPARRRYLVPKGLKPVKRKLATGETRLYWYHRATNKRLQHDPETAEGLLECRDLDARAKVQTAIEASQRGSYAVLWAIYRQSPEWRALKPRTRSDYQAVRDWLGTRAEAPLTGLTSERVYALRDKAASEKGRRFGNYVVQVMRLTLAWGKLRGHCKANPAKEVKLIRRPAGAKVNRAWTPEEIDAFLTDCPLQLAVPFCLGLFAGMRQGDALRVTWAAYDGVLRWTASKNGEACVAPVTGLFKTVLDKAQRGKAVQIATTYTGKPWTASGFRASFFKRVKALTLESKLRPGCTFHGLRHTVGTMGRNDGASDSKVAAAIGDRSTAMAELYGRDADRIGAQALVLGAVQKRYGNNDWKPAPTRLETAALRKSRKALMG